MVLCFIIFGCHYPCNQLRGKTRLQNDLLCVGLGVKPYTLTHSCLNSLQAVFMKPCIIMDYGYGKN